MSGSNNDDDDDNPEWTEDDFKRAHPAEYLPDHIRRLFVKPRDADAQREPPRGGVLKKR